MALFGLQRNAEAREAARFSRDVSPAERRASLATRGQGPAVSQGQDPPSLS